MTPHPRTPVATTGSASGSANKSISQALATPLNDALMRHVEFERVSFHMPGHKGRPPLARQGALAPDIWPADLTELPGLDDLGNPAGVLAELELKARGIWGSAESIISVNGATAGLTAAMLAIAGRASTVLVPRNAHRSVISGLALSGLFPLWYEPVWDDDWGLWGPVTATCVERLLERLSSDIAGLVVVSPTYAGALSEMRSIASCCRNSGVPLIVDEAHGAHFVPGSAMPPSAVSAGADIVVHSLHKSLSALTQTGLVHIADDSLIPAPQVRSALSLLQSTSPSYLLMASVEQALAQLEGSAGTSALEKLKSQCARLTQSLSSSFDIYLPVYGSNPSHVLFRHQSGASAQDLYDHLSRAGIFPETILGDGVLLMLGLGTSERDLEMLLACLAEFQPDSTEAARQAKTKISRPPETVQILSPRQVMMLPSEVVPAYQAAGRIAAETIAPCPPGTAAVVAGQRIPKEFLEMDNLQKLKVVVD